MIRVLLSLDLIKSNDQRDDFYDFLKQKKWLKTGDVDTVWTITYPNADPEKKAHFTAIKKKIASELVEAATELKLKKIYYVAQIGNSEVIARSIMKDDGEYKQFTRKLYPDK